MSELSLFERIGGQRALTAAVTLFYDKIMADDSVSRFFKGLDMDAQVKKQVAFMTMAFGGPHEYTGRDLRTAHADLVSDGLTDTHFDAVAGHLLSTLQELNLDQSLIDEAMGIVASTRDDVLGR